MAPMNGTSHDSSATRVSASSWRATGTSTSSITRHAHRRHSTSSARDRPSFSMEGKVRRAHEARTSESPDSRPAPRGPPRHSPSRLFSCFLESCGHSGHSPLQGHNLGQSGGEPEFHRRSTDGERDWCRKLTTMVSVLQVTINSVDGQDSRRE
jgi:hypothetical protein